jgi:hypothetical protein
MQVRVVQQPLIPGMEHGKKADVGSEPAPVFGDSEECFGDRTEQYAVDDARVLQAQLRKFLRQGEHHMAVRYRQQVGGLRRQPLIASGGLALGTMSIAARVVRDDLLRAAIALLDVSAEGGGAACADVPECPELLGREDMAPTPKEFLFVLTKDIGDFESPCTHLCRPSFVEQSSGLSWRASNGLGVA